MLLFCGARVCLLEASTNDTKAESNRPVQWTSSKKVPLRNGEIVLTGFFEIGTSVRMALGLAELSVLVDGKAQTVYYSLDGNHHYVVATPGPFQLQVNLPTTAGAVELLAFDGDMLYRDAVAMFEQGDPGEIFRGAGTFVVDHLVGNGTRTPLVFGEEAGNLWVKLYNQQRYEATSPPSVVQARELSAGNYVRGPEIAQMVINFGLEAPA